MQGQPQTRSLLDTTVTEFSISPGAQRFLQGSRGEQALTNHVEFLNRGRAEPDPHLVARCAEAQGQLTGDQVRSALALSLGPSLRDVTPFFVFPEEASTVIYTTNAIESLNMQLRKIIKTRGHFPNDESAIKLLWLALRNVLNKSVRKAFDWKMAMNQFAILYGERFTLTRN